MNKLTDFQRRKRLRERVAAWRAKKKAERLAGESAAQPVPPAAEPGQAQESQPVTGESPEPEVSTPSADPVVPVTGQVASQPGRPVRPKTWMVEVYPPMGNNPLPIRCRVMATPDLEELRRLYREVSGGEELPSYLETWPLDEEGKKALPGYLAMSVLDRARMHWETESTYDQRHAEFERRFNPPRSEPSVAPVYSERARIETLIQTLAGPLEPLPVPKAGL